MKENKRILIDADGVILNWEYAFHTWIQYHGHDKVVNDPGLYYNIGQQYGLTEEKVIRLVTNFNKSPAIGFLPPLRDSIQYIEQLYQDGYIFHVVTSVGIDPEVVKMRVKNLNKLYGAHVFEHIECLAIGTSKIDYLSQFKDTNYWWVEDNIQNAEDGLAVGLKPILIAHGYNMNYKNPNIPLVKNWKDAYELITLHQCTYSESIQ